MNLEQMTSGIKKVTNLSKQDKIKAYYQEILIGVEKKIKLLQDKLMESDLYTNEYLIKTHCIYRDNEGVYKLHEESAKARAIAKYERNRYKRKK